MTTILKTEKLRVEYRSREMRQGAKVALSGLDLEVRAGEVFGFLGPNGAGKTTTMNVLLGFVPPTSGAASLFGIDVRQPIARQRIGYLPELTYYYKFLTAEELLRFYAKIFGLPRAETDRRIDRTAQAGRTRTCRQAADQILFQRHAAARRPGAGAHQQSRSARAGRADQRPRSRWAA